MRPNLVIVLEFRVSSVSVSVNATVRVNPSGSVGVGFSANANVRESFDMSSVSVGSVRYT